MTLASPSERAAAIREQRAAERAEAERKKEMNKSQTKSRTGVVRRKPKADRAQDRFDSANRKAFEVLDAVHVAYQRESVAERIDSDQARTDERRQDSANARRQQMGRDPR
jgi:hypothetical protein